MQKLPIGIQSFSKLIKENCVYVDKTALIHEMVMQGSCYFLSRPRRFGKSLLVSTLKEIFSGNKLLFEGLSISRLPYEWKKHPVILLSFADVPCTTPEILLQGIKRYLQDIGRQHEIILDQELSIGEMLRKIVIELSKQESVVLLIDEYDYPILRHIHVPDIAKEMREILKDFYIVIKGLDAYLKFVFLTGVSKFSKTSIFSGLNNLSDISMDAKFNSLLGYTKNEIEIYLEQHVSVAAFNLGYSTQELLKKITMWYDGYIFSKDKNAIHLYNPFSVFLCLEKGEFSNYWFETGTPTFLINLLKTKNYPLQEFENVKATGEELGQFEIDDIELKTLMFQTGYLTIKGYNQSSGNYTLGYPNKETIDSLSILAIKSMTGISQSDFKDIVSVLKELFEHNNVGRLHKVLTQLFAVVPYTIQIGEEKYYQTIFYLVLKMLGADIIVEHSTNIGRIDAVIQTNDSYFIIEFKINSTASKAIEQIETKKYYQSYESTGKEIVLVGIAFDMATKNVSEIDYKVYCAKE